MNSDLRGRSAVVFLVLLMGSYSARSALNPDAVRQAEHILDATGIRSGFAVHLGCGAGQLTGALLDRGICLVQGLDSDADAVRQARDALKREGLYGSVSAEWLQDASLPYVDNVVNLIVADQGTDVAMDELMRVLAPRGVAYIKQGGQWRKSVKAVPANTDEWTHYRHDAGGNAVAHDSVVGPPRRLQWVAGPRHGRSHEYTATTSTLVSANGRIFYIADVAPTAPLGTPADWHLIARDAYNGLLIWKRPIRSWYSHLATWTAAPRELQRRMVAVGDRVYVTLGYFGTVHALDAATGKEVREFPETAGAEEIVCCDGTLFVVVRDITDEQRAEFAKLAELTVKPDSPLRDRDTGRPLFKTFRQAERRTSRRVLAVDTQTGAVRWQVAGKATRGLRPLTLCAAGGRLFYQAAETVCLDARTGEKAWSAKTDLLRTVSQDVVICAHNKIKNITALDAATGKPLWSEPSTLVILRGAFIIGDGVWLGGFKPFDNGRKKYNGPVWGPHFAARHDLKTGKLTAEIDTECPGHHHRCYESTATDRYLLVGRRGTEFYDLETGEVYWNSWARGVCRYGVMPCNGLLYKPPHACGCYITVKLEGFTALAPDPVSPGTSGKGVGDGSRLERGPAYRQDARETTAGADEDSWPTYRGNPARSGCAACTVPGGLKIAWRSTVSPGLTPPTVAGGKLYAACPDRHAVIALDADSGKPAWEACAGSRVDSPPTVYNGRVLYGCRDGSVSSLRASDGKLAWRFRNAGGTGCTVAYGQVESVSPIHGSVLVHDGVVSFVSGRSSYLNGGISLVRLNASTGAFISRKGFVGPGLTPSPKAEQYGPNAMPGARLDILSTDGERLFMQDLVFDREGRALDEKKPHLFALTGFLDTSWTHRSYWIYGNRPSIATGCSGRSRNLCYGRLLLVGDKAVFGYGRQTVHWSNEFQDGNYRLFARKHGEPTPTWSVAVPLHVQAMLKAGDALFVAGAAHGPDTGKPAALLLRLSCEDGSEISRLAIPAPPVFDGMAAAGGKLFLTLTDGTVVCLQGT